MIQPMKIIAGEDLVALIPQKPPFVLVSSLMRVTEDECTTVFEIPVNHVLCKNGVLQASGLIENMAQTCAAKLGYEYELLGKPMPIGFIGDVRDFKCSQLPPAGTTISTDIRIDNRVFDVTVISGKVYMDGKEIASCKMKVFIEEKK
jgi:predicted hotdog family 3-hydroxylacyl-ACP dehydratase